MRAWFLLERILRDAKVFDSSERLMARENRKARREWQNGNAPASILAKSRACPPLRPAKIQPLNDNNWQQWGKEKGGRLETLLV